MAIPKKPVVKTGPLGRLWRSVATLPYVIKEIPKLPKLKLVGLTGLFMCGSFFVYFMTGPNIYIWDQRRLREAQLLEKFGVTQSSTPNMPGTGRPYTNSYGLCMDYNKHFEKAETAETNQSESDSQ